MAEFWNLRLEPGKAYQREITAGIQVSSAVVDASVAGPQDDLVQVILVYEDQKIPVANFHIKKGITQVPLQLEFPEGSKVHFEISGAKVPVHLTGICGQPEDSDDDMYEELEDEEDEDDDEVPLLTEADVPKSKKRKAADSPKSAKKAKLDASPDIYNKLRKDDTMSSDSEDNDYNPLEDTNLSDDGGNLPQDETLEDEVDDEDDDDMDDDGEEIEGEEEDEEGDDVDEDEEDSDDFEDLECEDESEADDEEGEEQEKAVASQKGTTKMTNGVSKKDQKKNGSMVPNQAESPKIKKKDKVTQATTPKSNVSLKKVADRKATPMVDTDKPRSSLAETPSTPATDKKKKKKKNKNKESPETPSLKPEARSTSVKKEKPSENNTSKSPKQDIRKGGVVVTEVQEGTGAGIKPGQKASVYYKGSLKNGRVFDSKLNGSPFTFKLGAGEVIKGWDAGITGMKIGGKRKLTVPAHMAYGKQGAPPEIPPNSNLNFEVTLLGFK